MNKYSDELKIVYLNIGGLLSKDLTVIYDTIKFMKPHIICFSETHITEETDEKLYQLSDMGFLCVSSMSNSKHTGGAAIYIREDLEFRVVSTEQCNYCFWETTVEVKLLKKRILIGVCYRSPSSPINKLNGHISKWLNRLKIEDEKKKCILMGDFNVNWMKKDNNIKQLENIMSLRGQLNQIMRTGTRETATSNTLIDLVFSNLEEIKCGVVEDVHLSDHKAIKVTTNLTVRKADETEKKIPGKVDYDLLRLKLKECMNSFRETGNIDDDVKNLEKLVGEEVQNCRGEDVVINYKNYCKFFNKKTLEKRKKKIEAYRKFKWAKNNESEADTEIAWGIFKRLRNEYVAELRKSKRQYYYDKLDKCGDDSSKVWRVLKELLTVTSRPVSRVEADGRIIEDPSQVADVLNNFFIDSIAKINENIRKVPYEDAIHYDHEVMKDIIMPSKEDLHNILKKNKKKGSGELNSTVIKECWEELGDVVFRIVEKCINEGVMPDLLKSSTITPIPKVKGSYKPEDFRPINVLPALDKGIESIVHENITHFIKVNNILSECQSGFREQHSTESAILLVLENWRRALDMGILVLAVFIDLKRAFETINRNTLLKKLEKMKICGKTLKLIEELLSNRKQKVKINGHLSQERDIPVGLPQGSRLAPLLFLLFINDLNKVLKYCKIHLFADDTLIYIEGTDVKDMTSKLNEDLGRLADWMAANTLSVNVKKTKGMLLSRKDVPIEEVKLTMEGDTIEIVEEFRYLGAIIDKKLSFESHFDFVKKKIRKKLSVFRRLRSILPKKEKLRIFNAILRPHFGYCISLFFGCNKNHIREMEVLQNQAMRVILRRPYDANVQRMLKELDWISFSDMIDIESMTIIFKIHKGLLPSYLRNLLTKFNEVHSYHTRGADDFAVESRRTEFGRKSLLVNGVSLYNKLSDQIKMSKTVDLFKKAFKSTLE